MGPRYRDINFQVFRLLAMYCQSLGFKQLRDDTVYFVKNEDWIKIDINDMWSIVYKKDGKINVIPINTKDKPEFVLNLFKKHFNDKDR